MPPAVKRVLPPRSASGARSRTSTCAPFCAAAIAAHIAALPAPTTITSWFELLSMTAIPSLCENIFDIVAVPGDRRQHPLQHARQEVDGSRLLWHHFTLANYCSIHI